MAGTRPVSVSITAQRKAICTEGAVIPHLFIHAEEGERAKKERRRERECPVVRFERLMIPSNITLFAEKIRKHTYTIRRDI